MAGFDLSLQELQNYRPALTKQPNFDQFWSDTFAEAARQPLNITLTPLDLPYTGVRMFQTTYAGWHGVQMAGIYAVPNGDGPFPGVVIYHGYSGSKPDPSNLLIWTSQGYAVLAVDVRGQGGDSDDGGVYPGGHRPGFMTMGIGNPHTYYYRGVYVDSVRALETLAAQPAVDKNRIGVTGGSQGGGLSLATSALCTFIAGGVRVKAVVAEIPFLCHFERAVTLVDTYPYKEIADYCRIREGGAIEKAMHTLSYFDCMNLSERIEAATLVTVGIMDMICPPSTVFAAYNRLKGTKDIFIARFGEHTSFPGIPEARARWFARYV